MQQRYYDPAIGRFLSVDPVTASSINGGNFNRYWYANNNPYSFTDPDGRLACTGSIPKPECVRPASPWGDGRKPSFQAGGEEHDPVADYESEGRAMLVRGADTFKAAGETVVTEGASMAAGGPIRKGFGAIARVLGFGSKVAAKLPNKAHLVLNYVKKNGAPPPGYVGGKTFRNREGLLPSGGSYREFDVDLAPSAGGRRNAERIVVDDSTGRAWYTADHYKSFTEIP